MTERSGRKGTKGFFKYKEKHEDFFNKKKGDHTESQAIRICSLYLVLN